MCNIHSLHLSPRRAEHASLSVSDDSRIPWLLRLLLYACCFFTFSLLKENACASMASMGASLACVARYSRGGNEAQNLLTKIKPLLEELGEEVGRLNRKRRRERERKRLETLQEEKAAAVSNAKEEELKVKAAEEEARRAEEEAKREEDEAEAEVKQKEAEVEKKKAEAKQKKAAREAKKAAREKLEAERREKEAALEQKEAEKEAAAAEQKEAEKKAAAAEVEDKKRALVYQKLPGEGKSGSLLYMLARFQCCAPAPHSIPLHSVQFPLSFTPIPALILYVKLTKRRAFVYHPRLSPCCRFSLFFSHDHQGKIMARPARNGPG